MLIDWFTVVAQILNFLVLVWLLKRFLYRPILHAMESRQKQIQDRIRSAEDQAADAAQQRAAYEKKLQEWDQASRERLEQARKAAEAEKRRLLDLARGEYETQRSRWRSTFDQEQALAHQELVRHTQTEILALAGQVIRDLTGASLEEQLVEAFIRQIERLAPEDRLRWARPLPRSERAVTLATASPLPEALQRRIESAVRTAFGLAGPFGFEVRPVLGLGIELELEGRRISWTADAYLERLREQAVLPNGRKEIPPSVKMSPGLSESDGQEPVPHE